MTWSKKFFYFIAVFIISITAFTITIRQHNTLPAVAIANYGPQASLDAAIAGFKEQMRVEGFTENQHIHYETADML